jgi:hypothetical protein
MRAVAQTRRAYQASQQDRLRAELVSTQVAFDSGARRGQSQNEQLVQSVHAASAAAGENHILRDALDAVLPC